MIMGMGTITSLGIDGTVKSRADFADELLESDEPKCSLFGNWNLHHLHISSGNSVNKEITCPRTINRNRIEERDAFLYRVDALPYHH